MFKEINQSVFQTEKPQETFLKKGKNKLERTPYKDSFIKTNQNDNQNNKKQPIPKTAYIVGGAGIAVATTVGIVATGQVHKYKKQLKAATNKIDDVLKQNEQLNARIKSLSSTLDDIISKAKASTDADEKLMTHYVKLLDDLSLPYSHLNAPGSIKKPYLPSSAKLVKPSDIKPLTKPQNKTNKFIDPDELKSVLSKDGQIDITIPKLGEVKASVAKNAFLGDDIIDDLGKTIKTDITLDYGKRVNWSEQKIARDILQNFYDGHGNTLDGVQLFIQKLPNGQTKVKICGEGLFNHTNLQYIGAGNKVSNPYNAGGFGEGSKVLVANMLGKQDASSVKFSCADWDLVFGSNGNLMTRTLTKSKNVLNGNSIEFETGNTKLVDAIIDSVNYFKHSSNPDLSDLTYDGKDFAFKILKDGQKGNFYLTQRFEFGKEGAWQDAVEDLTVLFKRKPDAKKFKEITGKNLPQDRDRTSMTVEDIKDLTRYFASEMTDDELLGAINSTRGQWGAITTNPESKQPIKAFIDGISDELQKRNIFLDMADEKFAHNTKYTNDNVRKTLHEYGYHILPENFQKLGLYSTTDIFNNLSQHKALEPTAVEIKKIKILDEAMKIVQESMDSELGQHLGKANLRFSPENIKKGTWNYSGYRKELAEMFPDVIPSSAIEGSSYKFEQFIDELDEKGLQKFSDCVSQFFNAKLKSAKNSPNSEETKKLITSAKLLSNYGDDAITNEYFKKIDNLRIILPEDIKQPRYIFDRHNEIAQNTLGEAITDYNKKTYTTDYLGHWIDREYLNSGDFNQLLGTWLHENCHKSGGDGSAEFTYALTDLIRSLLDTSSNGERTKKLVVLQNIFNNLH